jgi:hypothetical protein
VEVVVPEEVQEGDRTRRRVVIEDECIGDRVRHRVSSIGDSVDVLRAVDVDRTSPPEVFFVLRLGIKGRTGGARILRFEPEFAGECSRPKVLFFYTTTRPPIKPPDDAGIANFAVVLRDFSRRFPGLEVRLSESYVGLREPLCCPSRRRITFYRFGPGRQRYVRYKSKLVRLR